MELNEIITFITNNGVAVVLMIYFLKNNYKSTQELINIVKELTLEMKEMKADQKTVLEVVKNCNKNVNAR